MRFCFSSLSEGNTDMKFLQAVILALVFVLGVNSLPSSELLNRIPRHKLVAQLRTLLAPGFKAVLDDLIKDLLDTTVRDICLNGSEDFGTPALDPLIIEHLDLDVNLDGTVQLQGEVDGVEVKKICTFVVDHIKANLLLLNVEFGVSLAELVVTGEHYNINGNLGGLLPVYGEGPFKAAVEGLSITGSVTLGTNDSYIYVKSLNLDLSLEKTHFNFEGLLGGGDLGDLANQIISDLVPDLLEQLKGDLLPEVSQAIVDFANEKLDGVTLQDILDLINNGGLNK